MSKLRTTRAPDGRMSEPSSADVAARARDGHRSGRWRSSRGCGVATGFARDSTGHDSAAGEDEKLGEGTGRQGEWAREDEDARAAKQEGDPHALDVEGDPRGGAGADVYRRADPRDVVQKGDVMMSGPGGAPQEGASVEERREASAETRERAVERRPSDE